MLGDKSEKRAWWNILSDLGNKYILSGQTQKQPSTITFSELKAVVGTSLPTGIPAGKYSAKVFEFDFMAIGNETADPKDPWFAKFSFTRTEGGSDGCDPVQPDNNGKFYLWSTGSGTKYEYNTWYTLRYEFYDNGNSDALYNMYVNGEQVLTAKAITNHFKYSDIDRLLFNIRTKNNNYCEFAIDNVYAATHILESCTVSVDANGGTLENAAPTSLNLSYGNAISGLTTPTKNVTIDAQQYASEFLGWYIGDTEVKNGGTWTGCCDEVITAKWADPHKVTLSTEYGTVTPSSTAFRKGQSYELSEPTGAGAGYDFLGWYDGETKVELTGTWAYDTEVTLTALWSMPYDLTLNVGDGTASVTTVKVKLENAYDLTTVTLTAPDGYAFVGWYTTSDYTRYLPMTGIWEFEEEELSTIYARFEKPTPEEQATLSMLTRRLTLTT